jgi:hypothetical protein
MMKTLFRDLPCGRKYNDRTDPLTNEVHHLGYTDGA